MVRRICLVLVGVLIGSLGVSFLAQAQEDSGRLITVYDRGQEIVFLTNEKTIGKALEKEGIVIEEHDTVEPSVDDELSAVNYWVNIYRARPVVVVDGSVRVKTVSPYQSPDQIASSVGISMYPEDTATIQPLTQFVRDGAGLELLIDRATPFTLDLYGSVLTVRSQQATVGDMLSQRGITLGADDQISVSLDTPLSEGLYIRIWREGIQTIGVDEQIPFSSRIVYDVNQPLGYRAVQTEGKTGVNSVSYEIEIKDGVEISRTELARITTLEPTEQLIAIGLYNDGTGLTASRGAQHWTDSKGISHRETYYDLPMNVVMQSCGQGGYYTVRPDGAKVDLDGYILIAANYGIYPKCSIVETSLGPGKVYDTGGFALRHPYGFDLATDWSRADGI